MAWIAALIGAAGAAGSASKQKSALKKANEASAAQQAASGGLSQQQMAQALQQYQQNVGPYQDIGGSAMNSLGGLLGLEGYRTKSDIALRELQGRGAPTYTEPTLDQYKQTAEYKKTKDEKLFGKSLSANLLAGTSLEKLGGFGAKKVASARRQAANTQRLEQEAMDRQAAAQYEQAKLSGKSQYDQQLADYNTQLGDLTKQRDIELQTYDPTAQLRATPGYQFRYNTGEGALQSGQAARHNVFSGRAGKELQQYGQDFASNEFGNEVNRLSNLMGQGFQASTGLGNAAIGQGNQMAIGTQNIGNQLAQLSGQRGDINANYYNNLNNVAQGGLSNYLTAQGAGTQRQRTSSLNPYTGAPQQSPVLNPNPRNPNYWTG
jgi:hypothetical protein